MEDSEVGQHLHTLKLLLQQIEVGYSFGGGRVQNDGWDVVQSHQHTSEQQLPQLESDPKPL